MLKSVRHVYNIDERQHIRIEARTRHVVQTSKRRHNQYMYKEMQNLQLTVIEGYRRGVMIFVAMTQGMHVDDVSKQHLGRR